jgi:hypothetical protein
VCVGRGCVGGGGVCVCVWGGVMRSYIHTYACIHKNTRAHTHNS